MGEERKKALLTLIPSLSALPALAKPPAVQVWSRVEGNTEHRLTIKARPSQSACCWIEGKMQLFVVGKLSHEWHLAQNQYANWWDEGNPVSITIRSDMPGQPNQDFNTMLLDKDTMLLWNGWNPNKSNRIYKRVRLRADRAAAPGLIFPSC